MRSSNPAGAARACWLHSPASGDNMARKNMSSDDQMDQEQTGGTETEGGRGKGSKPSAPRGRKGQTSGRRSTGAKKSANRAGVSGTGAKKGARGSSGRRRSGSRSGAGGGSRKKR